MSEHLRGLLLDGFRWIFMAGAAIYVIWLTIKGLLWSPRKARAEAAPKSEAAQQPSFRELTIVWTVVLLFLGANHVLRNPQEGLLQLWAQLLTAGLLVLLFHFTLLTWRRSGILTACACLVLGPVILIARQEAELPIELAHLYLSGILLLLPFGPGNSDIRALLRRLPHMALFTLVAWALYDLVGAVYMGAACLLPTLTRWAVRRTAERWDLPWLQVLRRWMMPDRPDLSEVVQGQG